MTERVKKKKRNRSAPGQRLEILKSERQRGIKNRIGPAPVLHHPPDKQPESLSESQVSKRFRSMAARLLSCSLKLSGRPNRHPNKTCAVRTHERRDPTGHTACCDACCDAHPASYVRHATGQRRSARLKDDVFLHDISPLFFPTATAAAAAAVAPSLPPNAPGLPFPPPPPHKSREGCPTTSSEIRHTAGLSTHRA